mgnify:CR=1 FL=1
MLTSDIQDLILSDFQLLLVLTCDESMRDFSPGEFHPDASQAVGGYGALNKPLSLGCHFWGSLQVPRSTWGTILNMTWDFYSSNFDGYGTENRKVISTFSVISIKMIQNGGFQFCPEKWSKSFNHGDDWESSVTWEPTSSGGTFDQSGLFLCQIWAVLEADGSGPRTKALQCLWCLKVGNT